MGMTQEIDSSSRDCATECQLKNIRAKESIFAKGGWILIKRGETWKIEKKEQMHSNC